MALQLSDLPEGYEIQERSERVASDVRQEGLDQGWKRGYVVEDYYYPFFQNNQTQ